MKEHELTISFSDEEMAMIMQAAATLRDRDAFLRSVAAQIKPRRIDLVDAIARAIRQQQTGEQDAAA